MDIKRVFLIVLDSVGAGEAPDAQRFGDAGAHTLLSVFNTGILELNALYDLGIGNIEGLSFLGKNERAIGSVARMMERSNGKDTTVGHWEIAGCISKTSLPTFPYGFPDEILEIIKSVSSRPLLCNKTYSGTKVIEDYGKEALERGALIIYTSADSVLQIAAHTDLVSLDELYGICEALRAILKGDNGVGRIIARPFSTDERGYFVRTADRRDYSIKPPKRMLPLCVKENRLESIAIGKIGDIFADVGFTQIVRTHSNREGMQETRKYIETDFEGLCFVNLVDFDMAYGHRRDAQGYAVALNEFDEWLEEALPLFRDGDVLIITADHGCDPCYLKTTDHTREYTPLVIYNPKIIAKNYGTRNSFADIGATVAELLNVDFNCDGTPISLEFTE